jgi:hypothetical protein
MGRVLIWQTREAISFRTMRLVNRFDLLPLLLLPVTRRRALRPSVRVASLLYHLFPFVKNGKQYPDELAQARFKG